MTTANKITLSRIFLIPVFFGVALYYGESFQSGEPREWLRYLAIAIFVVAAVSDGLDGFIARRFNQQTELGVALDPIADKGLMLSAILVLSIAHWPDRFPTWFPVVVIGRDVAIVGGTLLVQHLTHQPFRPRPHWTGKVTTFLQMIAIAWVMLRFPMDSIYAVCVAGLFTLISGAVYTMKGVRHLQQTGHAKPESKESD